MYLEIRMSAWEIVIAECKRQFDKLNTIYTYF